MIEDLQKRVFYYIVLADPTGKPNYAKYQDYKREAMNRFSDLKYRILKPKQWVPLDHSQPHAVIPHPDQYQADDHAHCQQIVQILINDINQEERWLRTQAKPFNIEYPQAHVLDQKQNAKQFEQFHVRWNPAIELLAKDKGQACLLSAQFLDFIFLDDFVVFLENAAKYFTDRKQLEHGNQHIQIVSHLKQLNDILERLNKDGKPQVSVLNLLNCSFIGKNCC